MRRTTMLPRPLLPLQAGACVSQARTGSALVGRAMAMVTDARVRSSGTGRRRALVPAPHCRELIYLTDLDQLILLLNPSLTRIYPSHCMICADALM
jgi:hypothetical protein